MKSIRKFHYILVFDDLMSQATESPVLFLLLTQGRHRNASVILLLQNMFPQGKFHTDISRNAHKIKYMVLFRSPNDRKQIGIIAERMFDKNLTIFMSAYTKETEKPCGYLLVDNLPKTTSDKQVVTDIFGECRCYPNIITQEKTVTPLKTDPSKVKDSVLPIPKGKTEGLKESLKATKPVIQPTTLKQRLEEEHLSVSSKKQRLSAKH